MFIELLRNRRSIRKFKDQPVEQKKIDTLIEAVLRSPSSRGLTPWNFVVVANDEKIKELSRAKSHGSSFLAGAPLAIAVCADPEKSDVWVEDTSIAALILHLEAADLGLGSCWIQVRNRAHNEQISAESYVIEALGLNPAVAVEAIIAIGYSDEEKEGRPADSLLFDRVSYVS